MAEVTHFFAGANSGSGFRNLFPELMDLEHTYDMLVLKGGPGVGKSTFMKEIGRTMEEAGTTVEYLWCSGDPHSLDGIVLPEIQCAVVDGTAPHIVEPRFPAAVDRYVDLGQFYDLAGAKRVASEVRSRTHLYKEAYRRAYHSLHAAREVELDAVETAAACLDERKLEKRVGGILNRELRKRGTERGNTSWRFLGGITHAGYVWRFDSVETLCPKVYVLVDRWERGGRALERIRQQAVRQGWNTIGCLCPENPEQLEHLLIPGLGLGFVTEKPGMMPSLRPYRRIRLDQLGEPEEKQRLRFQARLVHGLREEAVLALKDAKAGHDALEEVLHPYVDFESVQEKAALEAGRLLSYLS